jgi:hypothetical protein
MDDKYPSPDPSETWNVLEKYTYHDYTDDYDKYVIVTEVTKNDKTVQKKITKMYRNILIPNELKKELNQLSATEAEAKIYEYKEERLRKHAIEKRRKWAKFGMAANEEYNSTTKVSEKDLFFELTNPNLIQKYPDYHHLYNDQKSSNIIEKPVTIGNKIICRYCKGPHWTHNCHNKDKFLNFEKAKTEPTNEIKQTTDVSEVQMPLKTGSYVPPHRRGNNDRNGRGNNDRNGRSHNDRNGRSHNDRNGRSHNDRNGRPDYKKNDKEEVKGIKINNIAPYSDEEEIKNICLQYGRIYKFKLIKRQDYAFCFITYTRQDVADVAIEELKNIHLDSCVWNTEWAKY